MSMDTVDTSNNKSLGHLRKSYLKHLSLIWILWQWAWRGISMKIMPYDELRIFTFLKQPCGLPFHTLGVYLLLFCLSASPLCSPITSTFIFPSSHILGRIVPLDIRDQSKSQSKKDELISFPPVLRDMKSQDKSRTLHVTLSVPPFRCMALPNFPLHLSDCSRTLQFGNTEAGRLQRYSNSYCLNVWNKWCSANSQDMLVYIQDMSR